MAYTTKIFGYGWVGKAMEEVFPQSYLYDPDQGFSDDRTADIGIVAVPTPNTETGALDRSIVEEVVKNAKEPLLLIRSTVQPGTCDYLEKKYGKAIVHQPEYLGESVAHPLMEESARSFMIIGGKPENRRKIIELYQRVYNANISIRQVTNLESEIIKLSENRAIAFKVAQCQELYDTCELAGVDYYTIRDAVYADDPRFNLWFSFVYPDKRGMDSKCIPKDVYAWAAWAESLGYNAEVTKAILERNERWVSQ